MLTLYLTNHGHVLFVLFIRLTQYHHFRSVYIYMLCSHLEVWGDGGGSEMKWLQSSRPLLESNLPLDISNEPVGLFTAMSVVTGRGVLFVVFLGGISWLYLTGYLRDRWQEMGQERGDDMQPGRSTNWGTSEPQTQVFFGKVRSLPNPYKVFFVPNQIWASKKHKLLYRNVFQIWTIQMFIRSLQKRTTPTASLAIGYV